MVNQFTEYCATTHLCNWLTLPRSVYYYRPTGGRGGVKPSAVTRKIDGSTVSNEYVVAIIREILSQPFCCYGYHMITDDLKELHFIINHKKVYRLMDENHLLLGKIIRTSGQRKFVRYRRIDARYPMEHLCLDIKYIWVHGEKRNYYLLTIQDVYSRKIIEQLFQRSIRHIDVINVFRKINNEYPIKGVTVRNDNGSQFIANNVKQFLKTAQANQEFTHIATPQDNGYIEAFHSIVQREVVDRFEFSSFYDAKTIFLLYKHWYNKVRKHGQLGKITPQQKWNEYFITFKMSGQAEAGNAGEQPARNNLTSEEVMEGVVNTPFIPQNIFVAMPQKTQNLPLSNLNPFEKNVQFTGG